MGRPNWTRSLAYCDRHVEHPTPPAPSISAHGQRRRPVEQRLGRVGRRRAHSAGRVLEREPRRGAGAVHGRLRPRPRPGSSPVGPARTGAGPSSVSAKTTTTSAAGPSTTGSARPDRRHAAVVAGPGRHGVGPARPGHRADRLACGQRRRPRSPIVGRAQRASSPRRRRPRPTPRRARRGPGPCRGTARGRRGPRAARRAPPSRPGRARARRRVDRVLDRRASPARPWPPTGRGRPASARPPPGPHPGRASQVVEQRVGRVAQRLLVLGELEVHGARLRHRPPIEPDACVMLARGHGPDPDPRGRRPPRPRCGPGCAANLPWEYGTGLPPRFDDLADEVAFLRRWQADLAGAGWVGVTWPVGLRRARARPGRQLRRPGGAGPGPGPRARRAHRRQPGRAHAAGPRHRRAEGPLAARDPRRRRAVVPALQRARRRLRPRRGAHHGPARRRRLRRSTGARCGPPTRSSPTGACAWPAATPTSPSTRASSCFVVDMRAPGVEVRPLVQLTGEAEFNEVHLRRRLRARRPAASGPRARAGGWRARPCRTSAA